MDSTSTQMGCCLFLPRMPSLSRHGYRALSFDGYDSASDDGVVGPASVTVVVGKERRIFLVDPSVLEKGPFRILMRVMGDSGRLRRRTGPGGREELVFVDVDSILFEHMLWLANNDDFPSLLRLNIKDIVDFYAQEEI